MLKLYQLLASVEAKELLQLQAFLETPFFNTRASFSQLLQELIAFHPEFKSIDKQNLLQDYRQEERPHQQFINEQFSGLCRLVEQFLVQQELKRDRAVQEQLKLKAFQNRKMPFFFIKTFQNVTSILEARHPLHWEDTHDLWLTYHRLHNYFEAAALLPAPLSKPIPLSYLDEYFILVKLRHCCNQLARQAFYSRTDKQYSEEIPFINPILAEVQKTYHKHPIIQLYAQMVQLFHHWDEALFLKTETHFYRVYSQLETGEQYFVLLHLVNLANQQMNRGHTHLQKHILSLYQYGVARQLFLGNNQLTASTFLNICLVGANAGDKTWTADFIQRHQHLINDAESDIVVKLGRALFLFHSDQFDKAYNMVRRLQASALPYKVRIRSLTVRCLLELHLSDTSYFRVLRSEVSNFGQFITRNAQLSENTKQSYRNFNRAVLKIAELRQHNWGQTTAHQKLVDFILQLSPLIAHKWLIKKIVLRD